VMRTFSKIHSLAGLRIGFAVTQPEIVKYLELIRPPFNTNSLAQLAAEASLNDTVRLNKCRKMVQEEKELLCRKLEELRLDYVPSAANFVLIKMPINGKEVFNRLLKEGVIVRSMEEYKFPGYIRVTIGTKEENKKFVQALKKVLNR